MNFKIALFLIIPFVLFSGCSQEDDDKKNTPLNIAYVHEDGFPIAPGECINPDSKYAIAITAKLNKNRGVYTPTEVKYSINGIEHSMTFSADGTQLNSIKLVNGINRAQIIGTNYKTEVVYYSNDEFELVY